MVKIKNRKLLLLSLLIIPWLTIPFIGRDALKKYLPSTIFLCTFTEVLDRLGEERRWWRFFKGIPPFNSMNFFNWGPYFVASMWMLRTTYGRFPLYLIANLILQMAFTFLGGVKLADQFRVFRFIRLSKMNYIILNMFRATLLYIFQYINDKTHAKTAEIK